MLYRWSFDKNMSSEGCSEGCSYGSIQDTGDTTS